MKPSAQGVALGLGLAAFAAFQQFKLPVVLPAMLAEFGYPRTLAGGFMSVYAIAGLVLSIAVGHAVERRGAGRPIALALAAMAAGIALVLAAPGHGWLVLAGRGLEGAGFAALAVSGSVLATTNATPAKRALVTGMLAGWIPFGQLSAAAIAPPLVALGGWRLMWWAALALTLVMGCWTLLLVRRGRVLLRPAGKPGPGAAADGQLDRGQRRSLWIAGTVFLLWVGQYFGFMTWLPQYLVEARGLDLGHATLGYALPVALLMAMCMVTGWWIHRGVAVGRLMVGALAVQVACWGLLGFASTHPLLGLALLALYGLSAGVVPTCLFFAPARLTGGGAGMARAFGIMMASRNLGVLVGPIAIALLFEAAGGWSLAAPALGAATALALVLGVPTARHLDHRP